MLLTTIAEVMSLGLIMSLHPALVSAGKKSAWKVAQDASEVAANSGTVAGSIYGMASGVAGRIMVRHEPVSKFTPLPAGWCELFPGSCDDDPNTSSTGTNRDTTDSNIHATDANVELPPGVPQYNYDMCINDMGNAALNGNPVLAYGPVNGNGISVSRVPPTCMVLANFFVGDGTDGPTPIPTGSDSLQYNDLTSDQYYALKAVFEEFNIY
ncbi:hypothetical protein PMZ80_005964 [Knufia obscura]|uniref:Uncharacterized protein n=1 Tax=Knufia obscura TaxID=1635080 RepID=A0ABR0RN78_9EURO|nr:hypothetical protein PMZ80_005964 [Knufia obscura]